MFDKRCFSRNIIHSARFMKMPMSSQFLYFNLFFFADADGVVEAYPVMNLIKANEDDLRVLVGKEFLVVLNEDLVVFIVHWTEHNTASFLRSDRNSDSLYRNLLLEVYPEAKLIQRKPRSDTSNKRRRFSGQSEDSSRTAEVNKNKEKKNKDSNKQITQKKKNSFNDFQQTDYDIKAIENKLLAN